MICSIAKTIVLLLILCNSATISYREPKSIDDVLTASKKILEFLSDHKEGLNLDGLIGVRMYQGVLRAVLVNKRYGIKLKLVNELRNQDLLANSLSDAGIKIIRQKSPIYYKKLWPLIAENFWKGPFQSRSIDLKYLYRNATSSEAFDEITGDDCFALLMGTSGGDGCTVTEKCWDLMTQGEFSNYSLTHQVFYFMIGIEANCGKILEMISENKKQKLTKIVDMLCSNVWRETFQLGYNGVNKDFSDLFMEQIGFCGYAGYSQNFTDSTWLQIILSWQRPNGCYGILEHQTLNTENLKPNGYGTYRRKKRAESLLTEDGCLAHGSSVALSALSSFLWNAIME